MSAIAAVAFLVASMPGLSLEFSAPETSVLVGEPVKVTVRWRATADVPAVLLEDSHFLSQTLHFIVNDGTSSRRYAEYPRAMVEMLREPGPLSKGQEIIENYVLLDGGYYAPDATRPSASFLFPVAGQYSVTAVYTPRGRQDVLAESNAIAFTVSAPVDDEAAVLAALSADPRMRDGGGDIGRLKAMVEAHPRSRYLRRAKAAIFERRADDLHNREHPDTGESLWSLDSASLAAFRATQYRQMADDLMSDGDWGAFEEDRLALAITFSGAAGAADVAERARGELMTRFPQSRAAAEMRRWEAEMAQAAIEDRETEDTPPPSNDTTPPTLQVSPSPSTLPATYVMVPVTVTVTVRDDRDPQPAVRLESITCEEISGRLCSSSPNVEGAEFGTDDREFELQGAPPFGGRTRVFTIMYSATDASGNRTTATGTVSVTPPPPK